MKKGLGLGYCISVVGVVGNLLLFAFKYWVGLKSNSVAIIADAWHTLSDSLTSLVVIIGFKAASKEADKEHPFGHGSAEVISAVIIAALLASVGVHFLIDSIERLRSGHTAGYTTAAILIFVLSVILKEALAQWSIVAGKKFNLKSLVADGWHSRSDAVASVLVLVGIFSQKFFWWIDGAMGIGVSFFIIYTATDILKSSISPLIGEEPDHAFTAQLKTIITAQGLKDTSHHIHVHRYGDHTELTFHLVLEPSMDLTHAHAIADALEKRIKDEMQVEATIHVEPMRRR